MTNSCSRHRKVKGLEIRDREIKGQGGVGTGGPRDRKVKDCGLGIGGSRDSGLKDGG